MKKLLPISFFLIFITSLPSNSEEPENDLNYHGAYFSIGLGSGEHGFGLSINFMYEFIGFGISGAGGDWDIPEEYICDWCTLPYDWTDWKRYDRGFMSYDLLFKMPTIQRVFIIGSIGYYEHSIIDLQTNTDKIYPTEYIYHKTVPESGISWGIGAIVDIYGGLVIGFEYRSAAGYLINLGYLF